MLRPTRIIVIISMLTLIALLSCSNNGTAPEPEETGPSAKSAEIMPDVGGTVTATTGNGSTVQLTFPPGAVKVPTVVTVRPLAPTNGNWVNVALEPAGMLFFDYFDIDVTIADGIDITDAHLFLRPDDPVHFGTTVNGRTLEASLNFFGFADDSTTVIPAMTVGGPAAPAAAAGGGNNMGAGAVDCQQIIASTKARFDGFLALNLFNRAIEAALEISSLLQTAACPDAQTWAETAADIACDQLAVKIQDAETTPTVTFGDFLRQTQEIIDWVGVTQLLDPSCPGIDDFSGALDGEIADYIAFFQPRLAALTANDYGTFQDLKEEAVTAFDLMEQAQTLGLADAYDALDTKAFTPVTDQMRTIAYTMCQNDGWHYPISRVTPTGFFARRDIVGTTPPRAGHISPAPSQYGNISESNIFEDIQYCATKLEIVSVVASDAPLDTVEIGSDGAPGQKTDQGTLNVPTRGEISVGGKMGAFTCWNDLDGDTELAFVINGTDVLTLRRPVGATDYLNAGNETIDIAQAALAAGITPKEGSSHDLKIIRRRTRCDQRLWGDADYQIGKATINWKNPTMKTEVTLEDTLQARSSASVSVRVKVIDQLGQDGFFDGINVVLNVSGGVAALVSGTTDAQGYFRTSVTPNNPNLAILGDAPAQNLTITAVATSFEGVTAQDVGTALVLPCDATDYGFREGGTGQKTLQFGYLKASGQASAGNYVYATTEWDDDYAIYPNDTSLNGQRGYVYIKVHYKFTSTGFSDSRPAARVVIGPRNGYSSPFFWERNYNTPGGNTQTVVEDDWEMPLSCTFGRVSAPLQVNCDAFARWTEGASKVSAEVTWMGITKVTKQDGSIVSNYRICSGSGTDLRIPQ